MAKVRLSEGFIEDVVSKVELASKRAQIRAGVDLLGSFPEMGTSDLPASLARKYGAGIRKLSASPFVIVYEYLPDLDEVRVLGLYHERTVR